MVTAGRVRDRDTVTVHPNGKLWRRIKSYVLQRDLGICHACKHGGADGIDHDPVPLSECAVQGISPTDTKNLKAIHHRRPCPVCSAATIARGGRPMFCNPVKGNGSTARFRQLAADRTGLVIAGVAPSGGRPRRTPAPAPVNGDMTTTERPW